jgi:5'-nucleotidase (lipoprotein e(P4) family)
MQRLKLYWRIIALSVIIVVGCQTSPGGRNYPVDLKWVRQSVEHQAICIQTYRAAWQAVKSQAKSLDKDWAVVLDVDETALDNSRYQEILFEERKDFPYYWDEWVKREECPPVAGVKAFIDSVRSLGRFAHVVYITNRNAPLEEATRNNLQKAGLWQENDVLLCQQSRQDSKETRRREVIQGTGRCEGMGERMIMALVGDQLGDMEVYPTNVPADEYKNHYQISSQWGTKYFILPNPMYGYWVNNYSR